MKRKIMNITIIFVIQFIVFFLLTPVFEIGFSYFTNSVYTFDLMTNIGYSMELSLLFTVVDYLCIFNSDDMTIKWK